MARILIIEDDAQLRRLLRQLLETAGHEVREASSGSDGLQTALEVPLDLLITDILMSNGDGLETIREFRRLYPQVKIIAISGGGVLGDLDFLDVAERFGAHQTLHKPFSPNYSLTCRIDQRRQVCGPDNAPSHLIRG